MSSDLLGSIEPKLFMSAICALNMIPCWLLRRDMHGRAARMLNEATLLFGLGLPMLLFKEWLPRAPAVILGNMMVLAAMTLLWQVIAALSGRRTARSLVLLPPLVWLACWTIPAFRAQLDLRVAIAAGLTGLLILLPVLDLLQDGARGMPRRLLVQTGALHIAISVGRVVLAAGHMSMAASPPWVTLCLLNTLAYMMLWPALCTALLNRRWLDVEAERARRDELSGLLNRRGLLGEIAHAGPCTLLLFDIDHFKRINDQFGHASGDDAIIAFARTATCVLGSALPFGRIGGEEFVALIPHGDRRDCPGSKARDVSGGDALLLAERVRIAFAGLVLPAGITATVSVGVALFVPGEAASSWLARADRALYRAKRNGRNRIELCDGQPIAGAVATDQVQACDADVLPMATASPRVSRVAA